MRSLVASLAILTVAALLLVHAKYGQLYQPPWVPWNNPGFPYGDFFSTPIPTPTPGKTPPPRPTTPYYLDSIQTRSQETTSLA